MPDKYVLDLSRLEEAFEDDTAGIAELLEMALETGVNHRRAIREGLAKGDAEAVRRAAHGIKGSSGNIGANVVMRMADALEQRARAGDLSDGAARLDALDTAYADVENEVRAYRASLG